MATTPGNNRIVVLIDMDCFFCQVETKLQPEHVGKPLAVVQYNQWEMGGIIAVNYEARDFGVSRHMRGKEAKEKCPDIVLASVPCLRGKADTSRYRKAGREVIEVIRKHCNTVERASVDEAYLDITDIVNERLSTIDISPKKLISLLANTYIVGYSEIGKNNEEERSHGVETWIMNCFKELHNSQDQKLAMAGVIVEEIRASIYKETGFRCSAGIAQNKILAKLACGLHKPNRQTILPEIAIPSLYSTLPVKKVRNLGGKFGDIVVESLGCNVMGDLLKYSLEQLQKRFDEKTGLWLYNIGRGVDNEPVTNRLLSKSVAACKKFPGKQAISSLEVLKHWAEDLAAEVCERLEQDLVENQRRATLLVVSYHYYQNRNTISQSRSLTLNSYKPEKMAIQCVGIITKSTQCPIAYLGICATKFIPSKESDVFMKFFKPVKPEDYKIEASNSEIDRLETIDLPKEDTLNLQSLEPKEKSVLLVNKEDVSQNNVINKKLVSQLMNNKIMMKESKRILNNSLNMNAEDSPTSSRVFKLIQVCNEHDETESTIKRMSNVGVNNNDFQNSFFMNMYKTEEKNILDNVDVSTDGTDSDQHLQKDNSDKLSVNYVSDHLDNSDNSDKDLIKEHNEITVENPSVQLRDIFPNMEDIDPDILLLLPANLQQEARMYMTAQSKKQKTVKPVQNLPKTSKGKTNKSSKVASKTPSKKHSPLYSFLIKTDSNEHNVPLERCPECNQMIAVVKYSEHMDFHVAQNLYEKLNKPTSGENGVKRKIENIEDTFFKRPTKICNLDKNS